MLKHGRKAAGLLVYINVTSIAILVTLVYSVPRA